MPRSCIMCRNSSPCFSRSNDRTPFPNAPIFVHGTPDRKKHPECRYSSSISKACTMVDGNRSCETLRSILRSCPGVRPEQIYEDATRDGPSSSNIEDTPAVHPRLYRSDQVLHKVFAADACSIESTFGLSSPRSTTTRKIVSSDCFTPRDSGEFW